MRIHAIRTGTLRANGTFLRGEGFVSLLRRRVDVEFPVIAYVIEGEDGLIAVDTGLAADVRAPRRLRGFPPAPVSAGPDLARGMRERGLDPADVRTVVLTHLDWDHTGGLRHFPGAEVLVHRPEWAFAQTLPGRFRFRPELWPAGFSPSLYDLDDEPYGPFPQSRRIGRGLRLLPIPGHSPGQVALALERDDELVLFAADHALRADWLAEDLASGRELMLGAFAKADARETTRRLAALLASRPVVLLPSHDADAPARLGSGQAGVPASLRSATSMTMSRKIRPRSKSLGV